MRLTAVFLSLFLCFHAAAADERTELQNLYAALNALNQEQQSVYLQFQMLQELRRANDRALNAAQLGQPRYATEIPNFYDLVQAQRLAAVRGERLSDQTDALYLQFDEIRRQKALLHLRIQDLSFRR